MGHMRQGIFPGNICKRGGAWWGAVGLHSVAQIILFWRDGKLIRASRALSLTHGWRSVTLERDGHARVQRHKLNPRTFPKGLSTKSLRPLLRGHAKRLVGCATIVMHESAAANCIGRPWFSVGLSLLNAFGFRRREKTAHAHGACVVSWDALICVCADPASPYRA